MEGDSGKEMAAGGKGDRVRGSKRVEVSGEEVPAGRDVSEMEEAVAESLCDWR